MTAETPPEDRAPMWPPIQVAPANVLRVRAVLLAEADRLEDALTAGHRAERDWVALCAGDPLSADASAAFNRRIDDVVAHCQQYTEQLRAASDSLALVARDYGHTEQQIAASYRRRLAAAPGADGD